jgi:hypothetical protein
MAGSAALALLMIFHRKISGKIRLNATFLLT